MINDRFDRSERLFGKEGQGRIRAASVAVIGAGGLGTHVIQQLAILGVGGINIVDCEELDITNRNRYVGVWHDDPIPGSPKVNLAERHVRLIDPSIYVKTAYSSLLSQKSLDLLMESDYVFGCLDNDGVRFVLNEMCLAYRKCLVDLASDVLDGGAYGGRVSLVNGENGCLHCREILDRSEVRRFLLPDTVLDNEDAIYGVDRSLLGEAGPSVGSLNGVIANLAVTEFMVMVTGLRASVRHLEYRGDLGVVRARNNVSSDDCYYCNVVKGSGDSAEIKRYFQ